MPKLSLLDKLKKELAQVEKQLEKYRNNVADFSMTCPRTQRRWKSEKNWDYYGRRKFELQGLIEDEELRLKEEGELSALHCVRCQAMFEEECCCDENE